MPAPGRRSARCRGPRAQAGRAPANSSSATSGTHAVGLAQKLVHPARREGAVEAALFDRRADEQAAVLAGNQVDALAGDDPAADRVASRRRAGSGSRP